jgi:regulator of sigma E protease
LTVVITVVVFLIVLAIIIIFHELGHFGTAKAFGIKVEEFGVGFPPRLLSFTRGETRYSLNAVPLGGFTKLAGEEDPEVPRSLASQSKGVRILVLGAGSLMNAMLPILLLSVAFMVPYDVEVGEVYIAEVRPDSPAYQAGIEVGDVIVSIDNREIRNISDLQVSVQLNLGKEIAVSIRHSDMTTEEVWLVPRWKAPPEEGPIGVVGGHKNPKIVRESYPVWQAVPMGITECLETYVRFKNVMQQLLIGAIEPQITGPVGIAQVTGEIAQYGIVPLLQWSAFLSMNLAVLNLFPIPGLDGGRIVFVLLEWVRGGRRITPKTEGLVHLIGFALLMAVIVYFTYFDILRIISGESLLP